MKDRKRRLRKYIVTEDFNPLERKSNAAREPLARYIKHNNMRRAQGSLSYVRFLFLWIEIRSYNTVRAYGSKSITQFLQRNWASEE